MMKRLFDFITSFCGLILLFPIFVLTALWIKADSRGPVFFRQARVGHQGIVFRIHKFRTMALDAEKEVIKSNNRFIMLTLLVIPG